MSKLKSISNIKCFKNCKNPFHQLFLHTSNPNQGKLHIQLSLITKASVNIMVSYLYNIKISSFVFILPYVQSNHKLITSIQVRPIMAISFRYSTANHELCMFFGSIFNLQKHVCSSFGFGRYGKVGP